MATMHGKDRGQSNGTCTNVAIGVQSQESGS